MSNEQEDPEIIFSEYSGDFISNGIKVEVHIYRLENTAWTLEVVDQENNSIVWDDEFKTDDEAYEKLLKTVEIEGLDGILRDPRQLH